jgi:hypothetical protein
MPDINDQYDPRHEDILERAPYRSRETLEDDLTKFFASRMPEIRTLSPSPKGAALRFLGLMEPPNDRESPQVVGVPGKRDAQRILDPYYDRVWHCAKRFVRLPAGAQQTIVDNAKTCPWRGDDVEMYVRIAAETERMHEMGVEAYKAQAMAQLRSIIAGRA